MVATQKSNYVNYFSIIPGGVFVGISIIPGGVFVEIVSKCVVTGSESVGVKNMVAAGDTSGGDPSKKTATHHHHCSIVLWFSWDGQSVYCVTIFINRAMSDVREPSN